MVVRHGVCGVLAQELYTPPGISPSPLSPQMCYFQRLMKHPEMKGLAQGHSLREVEPGFHPMSGLEAVLFYRTRSKNSKSNLQ